MELVRHRYACALVVALLVLATGLAYGPGLAGGFVFDDYVNLNALGRYGGVHDLQTLSFYLTSGIADPTGRPVAMASFLLDAQNWPAEPFPFKRTNLLIHLTCGLVLYSVLLALGHHLSQDARRVRIAAMLAAALWLMNPLWVSTVLYVVQRHAMLAALFALAGIRSWIASRNAFDSGNHAHGVWLALLAVPVFGALAGLSKANGFLLPLLLAVLELTVLRTSDPAPAARQWAIRLLVWLPAALLLGWLGWHALQIGLDGTQGRPWTLGQRLLTQPRVLCDYLWQLFVPGLNATGVFADGFEPSQSWRTPWSTLPALLAIGTMAGAAWVLRRRVPVLAAALGFFLAGHVMESSVVMLELYFEHRNYLPAALLFWPLAWWLAKTGRLRLWLLAGAIGYASLMLLATTAQARLWGDPLELALVWAEQNPNSARAQTHAFHQERETGREQAAEQRLATLLATYPDEPQYALNLLNLRCDHVRVAAEDIQRAAAAIRARRGIALDMSYQWLAAALLPSSGAACSSLPETALQPLFEAAIGDPAQHASDSPEMRARTHRLTGLLALRQQDCAAALQAFDKRIAEQPRPEFVQSHVILMVGPCGPGQALVHLRHYLDAGAPIFRASSPMLRLRDRIMSPWWRAHWEELRRTLAEESQVMRPPSSTFDNILTHHEPLAGSTHSSWMK